MKNNAGEQIEKRVQKAASPSHPLKKYLRGKENCL
jgi:hypothetical protein